MTKQQGNSAPHYSYPPPRQSSGTAADYANYKKILGQLELGLACNGRVNSWLESMKASSPTQIRPFLASSFDPDYNDWIEKHPSALSRFEEITAMSRGKKIVMFLDYDGTLSPIVDDPDCAFMSDAMREAVRDVAKHFTTAIVSGRCRDKVYSFVQLGELYYAGSHGMDIGGPTGGPMHTNSNAKAVLFQPASEFLPMMDEVYEALSEKIESIPGANVENNKFCISVHFRRVEEKKWHVLIEHVRSVVGEYPKLRITQGRKVLEIRPPIKWDKGKALEFLLESLGFGDSSDVFPVYIGDDRTDEDAFKVLLERGQGVGILVSKSPKDTCASYSLQEPSEVMDFLHGLIEWKCHSLNENEEV
ncbi:probable trehalose-phosphate phosphatase 6 [Ananas comosus]|uniref:Trehalose 6-phosphate phosphatase n=1 Tax=Ananas comosus TaxID=4615 RepID=A0A6P5G6V3_ANACO|nr:probable trehalose-phosphate phosphatase 6 [Ananas comosus]